MTHNDGRDRRRGLLEGYERTRRDVTEHAVIDAAEDILAHAWIDRLDRERRSAVTELEAAAEVVLAARKLLGIAESGGDAAQLRSARALHTQAEQDLAQTLAETRATLSRVDAQLRSVGRAALGRLRRRRADNDRLRSARRAMGEEAGD